VNGREVSWPESGQVTFTTKGSEEYTVEYLDCPNGKTFWDFGVMDYSSSASQRVSSNPLHLSITKTTIEVYAEYVEDQI
jgi:hypothetical protein